MAKLIGNRPLDGGAAAYARLLADPCNSAVVHPVYPGGDAGYLFRAESFVTLGNGATDTSGYLHWTPGYVNSSNTQLLAAVGATSTGAVAAAASGSNAPGTQFLATNAKGARCVAACLKVMYPGAESGRSGRIHYGHTSSGLIDLATSVSPDNVALTLQHYSRTPPETLELVWKPNIGDTEFNDPSETASAVIKDRKSAITVSWAGLPVNTGLVFHFTAVYEWTPAAGLGVGHNTLGKNVTSNTLDNVLDFLVDSGFKFVRHASGNVVGGAIDAVMSRISRTYGIMPAKPSTRAQLTYLT